MLRVEMGSLLAISLRVRTQRPIQVMAVKLLVIVILMAAMVDQVLW